VVTTALVAIGDRPWERPWRPGLGGMAYFARASGEAVTALNPAGGGATTLTPETTDWALASVAAAKKHATNDAPLAMRHDKLALGTVILPRAKVALNDGAGATNLGRNALAPLPRFVDIRVVVPEMPQLYRAVICE